MEPFDRIRRFLADVRSRLNRHSLSEALLAALAIIGVTLLVSFGVAQVLGIGPGRWGWLAIALGVGLAGYAAYTLWLLPKRKRSSDEALALWVEDRVDGLKSGVITSVQTAPMMTMPASKQANQGFSPALAEESARLTSQRLAKVDSTSLLNKDRFKKLAMAAGGVLLVGMLIAAVKPSYYADGMTALTEAPFDDVVDGERLVAVAVSQLTLEIHEPAYTQTKPKKISKSSGDFQALRGSKVRFAANALYPVEEAMLVLESSPEARWPLEVGDGGTIRGSLNVGDADRYQFMLVEPDGTIVREKVWREVDSREDQAPVVDLLLPESDVEVKAGDNVALFFEASDDYGVEEVSLVVSGDDGNEIMRRVVVSPRGERLARGDETIAVAELSLDAGESVDVYFEANDKNDVNGPGVAKSTARRITLYSPDAERDRLLADLKQLVDQVIANLADRLESPIDEKDKRKVQRYIQLQQIINGDMQALISTMQSLLARANNDEGMSETIRSTLLEVIARLEDVNTQEHAHLKKAVIARVKPDPAVTAMLLLGSNEEAITEEEQAAIKLKKAHDRAVKDRALDLGKELIDTQNEMMDLLRKLKDEKDPAALKAALEKLKKLQEKMAKLQAELAKLRERTPYENQNPNQRPSQKQQDMKDMGNSMDKIQKLLEEGKIDEAMKMLEEMQNQMQNLMAALEEDFKGGQQGDNKLAQKLNEAQQKLGELADGQEGIRKETQKLDEAMKRRQDEALKQKLKEQLDDAAAKADELKEVLETVDPSVLPEQDKQALEKLKEDADQAKQQCNSGKPGAAEGTAQSLVEGTDGLKKEVAESEARESEEARSQGLKDGMDKLGEANDKAKELAEMLKEMNKGGGPGPPPPSQGEQQQANDLQKKQQQLQEGTQQLEEMMKELDGQMPGLGNEMKPGLERAKQQMQQAGEQLGQGQPNGADGPQQQAAEELQSLEQKLAQKQQQMKKGDQERGGVNDPNAKVAIPEEDKYEAPKAFREEVLKAMGEQAPEKYKEAIERFYKELVK